MTVRAASFHSKYLNNLTRPLNKSRDDDFSVRGHSILKGCLILLSSHTFNFQLLINDFHIRFDSDMASYRDREELAASYSNTRMSSIQERNDRKGPMYSDRHSRSRSRDRHQRRPSPSRRFSSPHGKPNTGCCHPSTCASANHGL